MLVPLDTLQWLPSLNKSTIWRENRKTPRLSEPLNYVLGDKHIRQASAISWVVLLNSLGGSAMWSRLIAISCELWVLSIGLTVCRTHLIVSLYDAIESSFATIVVPAGVEHAYHCTIVTRNRVSLSIDELLWRYLPSFCLALSESVSDWLWLLVLGHLRSAVSVS